MLDDANARASVLEASNISKSFGSVPVLFSLSMDLRAGEVHALIGENGAGKSTFMKVLAGFHQPTKGRIKLDGKEITLPPNGEAEALGVVLIHQELNLAEQMTVEENVFLGREISRFGMLDRVEMRRLVQGYLDQVGLDIRPTDRVSDLSIAEKQMVEIVKAISRDARVLIMDEPTAVLTEVETEMFFEQVRRLRDSGVSIMFVSHKLAEVEAISDRITVLRDGHWITTTATSDLNTEAMAQLMVGRELSDMYPPVNEVDVDAPVILKVENLTAPGCRNIGFELRRGEILGFSGLVGSGRSALVEAIVGLEPITAGQITYEGEAFKPTTVARSRDKGIVYLTKDRKEKGLLLGQQMRPNLTLLALSKFANAYGINRAAEDEAMARATRRFDIRAKTPESLVGNLSGGNQQKLLLAKVMEAAPKVLIVDEPTRGIDVGTKQQIYHFLAALALEGVSIIVISSEMPEVIGMSHRVVVMREGEIAGALSGDDINEQEIMRYAAGLKNRNTA
ncbi:sugar ABC transporter ATP-binding protein [Pseudooctadecabacter sp.]|uniref:sugar ABC transporter ATP-binding protein n=1 Tax=Pseudooctadecabacter sp. TaxID=1966338 RepID=UPI0035C82309